MMEQPQPQQPWPSELNSARAGQGLELKDKYTVKYCLDGRHSNDVGAIQSNHPVPSSCAVYYFEVHVMDQGLAGKVAVGFADKNFKLTRQPGWEVGSYGYHGDDGKKFIGSGSGEDYGPTFGTGDTVGAGIHLGRQELFFTKNGTKLKVAHRPVRAGLYPTVGLHSKGEMVQVNFGQKPWVFDLEGMIAEEKVAHKAVIDRIPVSPGVTHQLVRQYLQHYGYADTLRAFDAAAGLLSPEEQAQAMDQGSSGNERGALAEEDEASRLELRSRVRRCVLCGDVDGAVGLLQGACPAVLQDAGRFGDVHFALSSQKYIELVRQGRVEEAVAFAQGTLAQLRGASATSLETALRDVVALIAYQHPETSPLAHLLSQGHREAVADAVNAAVLAVTVEAREQGGGGGEGAGVGGGVAGAGGKGGLELLRPMLSVPGQQRRPVSRVEGLLQQLVAVQGTLHEANGAQGSVFVLREHMLGPSA